MTIALSPSQPNSLAIDDFWSSVIWWWLATSMIGFTPPSSATYRSASEN
ncbi:MAG: hypothetical protein ACXVXC_00505 [Nocardioidaceae bacterium]